MQHLNNRTAEHLNNRSQNGFKNLTGLWPYESRNKFNRITKCAKKGPAFWKLALRNCRSAVCRRRRWRAKRAKDSQSARGQWTESNIYIPAPVKQESYVFQVAGLESFSGTEAILGNFQTALIFWFFFIKEKEQEEHPEQWSAYTTEARRCINCLFLQLIKKFIAINFQSGTTNEISIHAFF